MGRPKGRNCGHDDETPSGHCRGCRRERQARARERAREGADPQPRSTVTAVRNQHTYGQVPMSCLICDESFQTHPLRSCLPLRRGEHSPMRGVLAGEGRGAA